ncbi:MAG: alanine racemase [bacterium]
MKDANENILFRPTWATVDLAALAHNYEVLKSRVSPRCGIMAMVKADAYGHGAVQVSKTLAGCGVRALGVATVEEGLELRNAGIKTKIVVMGGLMGMGSPASKMMVDADLTPVINSSGVLDSLEADAEAAGRRIAVHLKIDTGMSRLGVRPESLGPLLAKIQQCPHLAVEGVMTHLAEADHEDVSETQMELFLSCREKVEQALGKIKIWHVANSMAVLHGKPVDVPHATEVWVRPGLALYGDCNGSSFAGDELKLVMGLMSKAVLLKRVPEGTRISYGGTFTTLRPTRLAIVPIGYADGYPWALSNKASVLILGKRAPVVGRVTMDMIVVDITDVDGVIVGDEVVLLGAQGSERITLHDIASWAGTITYEILCGISKRIPRIYRS